ncbi:MAG: hypothetical protein MJ192_00270 [Clostridia bacterium]|nr:hypothetical protein [Clostridia bacterium]
MKRNITRLMIIAFVITLICTGLCGCGKAEQPAGNVELLYEKEQYIPEYSYQLADNQTRFETGLTVLGAQVKGVADYTTILCPDNSLTPFDYTDKSKENGEILSQHVDNLKQISTEYYDTWSKWSKDSNLFFHESLTYHDQSFVVLEFAVMGNLKCLLYSADSQNQITAYKEFFIYTTALPEHRLAVYNGDCICVNDVQWFDLNLGEISSPAAIEEYKADKETIIKWLNESGRLHDVLSRSAQLVIINSQRIEDKHYTFFKFVDEDNVSPAESYFAEFTLDGTLLRLGKVTGFIPNDVRMIMYDSTSGDISTVSF